MRAIRKNFIKPMEQIEPDEFTLAIPSLNKTLHYQHIAAAYCSEMLQVARRGDDAVAFAYYNNLANLLSGENAIYICPLLMNAQEIISRFEPLAFEMEKMYEQVGTTDQMVERMDKPPDTPMPLNTFEEQETQPIRNVKRQKLVD